ncbi:hypothetical protein HDU79_002507, partial [Rhizoclosmatium sp. JEL0117]
IPVYMESLEGVVDPTVKSVQRAITEYELQGGTVNIYINDDGMQNLSPDQALTKMKYYGTFLKLLWRCPKLLPNSDE